MKLGILGGTFDPIHCGHIAMAQAVLDALDLDKVIFVPAKVPPHKDPQQVSVAEERYAMTCRALEGYTHFEASDSELRAEGVSYTVTTLRRFREHYGAETGLFFIIGSDNAGLFSTWKEPEEILRLARLIIIARPDFVIEGLPENAQIVAMEPVNISSSDIRERVLQGKSLNGLVPPEVEAFIKEKGMYR